MPSTFTGEDGRTYRLVSGTIRNTGTGWALINDSGHRPTGLAGVVVHPDHIEIQHSFTAVRVSSVQVTPDETYAARGLRAGVSVGLALCRIYLYTQPADGSTAVPPADPSTVSASSGNLWITGWLEI